jgi:AcrR family transcriptional regulator
MATALKGRRPPVSHPQREKAHVRPAVLNAARALFKNEHYSAISVERIAAVAQVTRHSLNNHFTSKDEIFRLSRESLLAEVAEKIADYVPAELAINDGVSWFLDHCYGVLSSIENREVIISITRDGEHHRWLIDSHHRSVRERLMRIFEIFLLYHIDRPDAQMSNPRAVAEQLLVVAESMAYGPYCKGHGATNPPDKRERQFDIASRAVAAMFGGDCRPVALPTAS